MHANAYTNKRDTSAQEDTIGAFFFGSRNQHIFNLSQQSLCTHNSDFSLYNYFSIFVKKNFPTWPLFFLFITINLFSHAQKNMSCVSAVWSYCDCGPIGGSHWWLFFNKLFYLSGRNVLKTNTPELQCPAAGHTSCNHSSSIRSGPTLTLSLQISV